MKKVPDGAFFTDRVALIKDSSRKVLTNAQNLHGNDLHFFKCAQFIDIKLGVIHQLVASLIHYVRIITDFSGHATPDYSEDSDLRQIGKIAL